MSHSYKVNSGPYGGGPAYPSHHYAYSGHEMTEYNRNGNKNGGYSHSRSGSSVLAGGGGDLGNYKGGTVAAGALDEDDDEYERGHWGSKAEFILSCVGFSVSVHFYFGHFARH